MIDGFRRDTNFLLSQALEIYYIQEIFHQLEIVRVLLVKYQNMCTEQIISLKRMYSEFYSIDVSQDLIQIFTALKSLVTKYRDQILPLSHQYYIVEEMKGLHRIIIRLTTLYMRMKEDLADDIRYKYQDTRDFILNPLVSVEEAAKQAHMNMGFFKMIYYGLLQLLNREVFNTRMMTQVFESCDSVNLSNEKTYMKVFRASVEARLSEHVKNPFYPEMVRTLELALILYIQKVKEYMNGFVPNQKQKDGEKDKKTL